MPCLLWMCRGWKTLITASIWRTLLKPCATIYSAPLTKGLHATQQTGSSSIGAFWRGQQRRWITAYPEIYVIVLTLTYSHLVRIWWVGICWVLIIITIIVIFLMSWWLRFSRRRKRNLEVGIGVGSERVGSWHDDEMKIMTSGAMTRWWWWKVIMTTSIVIMISQSNFLLHISTQIRAFS